MKIFYIFPHPDDESFGPAPAIYQQHLDGHEVHLLTLTKGEATRMRKKFGMSKEEMGDVREKELLNAGKVLELKGQEVLELPDSGLKDYNPIKLEAIIREKIETLKPDIVVTYPVHGISGFFDHLVCHASVKRVFAEMKAEGLSYPSRLAFITLKQSSDDHGKGNIKVKGSSEEDIDCVYEVSDLALEKFQEALDAYVTYEEVIEQSGVRKVNFSKVYFEIYDESHDPPLKSLVEKL